MNPRDINWNCDQATAEGWGLHSTTGTMDVGDIRIERLDEAEILESDFAAWELVVTRALAGSAYHLAALAIVRGNNATEWDAISEHLPSLMRLVEEKLNGNIDFGAAA